MKAVILAGGLGKRLRPITDYVPKPLISINNIPVLERQIIYLKKFGVNKFIVCTGYKTEQIRNFLDAKNNFGVEIKLVNEKKPLGTGGAIKNARKLIDEKTFFVLNGDVITNININLLKSKQNSIAAVPLRTKFGIMDIENDKVVRFSEKKNISDYWMNAGIYYLSNKIINDLPKIGNIEDTTFPTYAKESMLSVVKFKNAVWYSIDSYKDIEECEETIKKKLL
ncbi:MAG: nucleotidyltransferase family protein [Nitrosopumilales archaeon]|nr:nucleotidyltransferase family protein [Nitrosopumilales archaeon]